MPVKILFFGNIFFAYESRGPPALDAGILEFRGKMAPSDKVRYITELQQQRRVVGMVGDGQGPRGRRGRRQISDLRELQKICSFNLQSSYNLQKINNSTHIKPSDRNILFSSYRKFFSVPRTQNPQEKGKSGRTNQGGV